MLYYSCIMGPLLGAALLTAACSQGQDNHANADQPQATTQAAPGKKGKKGGSKKKLGDQPLPPGLRRVGTLTDGILESSGLCAAPEAGTYFTFGDDGQQPLM